MKPFPPLTDKSKTRPTLGNAERRVIAALIVSKLPGITVDWKSGHGRFLAAGRVFSVITREGDLALTLAPERMEELLGKGEAKPMQFGKRLVAEQIVIDAKTDPAWALTLLQEARQFAERSTRRTS